MSHLKINLLLHCVFITSDTYSFWNNSH